MGIAASYVEKNPLSGLGSALVGGVSGLALSILIQGNKAVEEETDEFIEESSDDGHDDEQVFDRNHPNWKAKPIPVPAYNTEDLNRNEDWLFQFEDWNDDESVAKEKERFILSKERLKAEEDLDAEVLQDLGAAIEKAKQITGRGTSLQETRALDVEESSDDGFDPSRLGERTVEELNEDLSGNSRKVIDISERLSSLMQPSFDGGDSTTALGLAPEQVKREEE